MPCDYRNLDSLILYRSTLADLSTIFDDEHFDEVLLMGDFNCDPNKGRFFKEFINFTNNLGLQVVDLELPNDSFTYVSSGQTCSTSWLDHIVSSKSMHVHSINIMYGYTFNVHLPIECVIFLPQVDWVNFKYINQTKNDKYVLWNKINDNDIGYYEGKLRTLLSDYNNDALFCTDKECHLKSHKSDLDKAYEFLKNCIFHASSHLVTSQGSQKFKIIPGWNTHCKNLHYKARSAFLKWKDSGKLRSGIIFDEMKSCRTAFNNALNYCKKNETKMRKSKLLSTFSERNKINFWKEINTLKQTKNNVITCINNETDPVKIAQIFSNKYEAILNNKRCQTKPQSYDSSILNLHNKPQITREKIFPFTVKSSIEKLNPAIGWDFIHTNHIKYGGTALTHFLSRLFSSFIIHNHVPLDLMFGEIRPIIKDKLQDKCNSDNYRPIMNSSNFLKLFEYCILKKLENVFKIDPHQFGFRKNTGCIMAASVLKETVLTYNSAGSNVHCCFLDLTKAFDCVNFNILFTKLVDCDLSPFLVNILKTMFDSQYATVVFNNTKSNNWKINNGVRQGGILSPLLFNLYINNVISLIAEQQPGCSIDLYKTNIIGYADDVSVLAPSANGLQFLLDKLTSMLSDLGLVVNPKKSAYMIFRTKKYKKCLLHSNIFLNNECLKIVSEYKYLGIIFTDNLCWSNDFFRCSHTFVKQFNSIYHKFSYVDINVMSFLFEAHCTSFYGMEIWPNLKNTNKEFGTLAITYHNAMKKIAKLDTWDSNHLAADKTGLTLFTHLINKRQIAFLFSLCNGDSPCIMPLKQYFRNTSSLTKCLKNKFLGRYSINNIFSNELLALKARINFVQRREQRSTYGRH